MRRFAILSIIFFLTSGPAWPQEAKPNDTEERLKALEERIIALEAEVRALKAAQTPATAAGPSAPAAAQPSAPVMAAAPQTTVAAPAGTTGLGPTQLPVYGSATTAAKVLNPDVSAIGDFLATTGHDPVRGGPGLDMHETELGLQAIVDPYARGDVFLSFGPEGVELEEGYLTFTALPGGLVAKVGKMRSSFGVVNTLHTHTLPWADRPLVTENLLGGEEGLSDAGISVSRILPAPKDVFLEATGQVYRGESAGIFAASRRSDVAFVGHLRGYRDLTESTNVDLGFSYARGHNEEGSGFITQLYGADATFRWKPLRRAIYHNFLARAELVWSRRQQPGSIERAFGFYTSADYRLSRRWTVGGRYDRSGRADEALLTDSGFAPVLTYWPSEFSQVRSQYRFTRYADGRSGNDLIFQFLFSLGAHGAHPF